MDYDNPDDNAEIQTDEIAGLRLLAGLSVEFKYLRSLYRYFLRQNRKAHQE